MHVNECFECMNHIMFFIAYGKVVKVHWQLSTLLPPSFHLSISQKIIQVREVLHLQNWDLIDTLLAIKFYIFWISYTHFKRTRTKISYMSRRP